MILNYSIDIIDIIIFYHPKTDKENYFNVEIDNGSDVYEDSQTYNFCDDSNSSDLFRSRKKNCYLLNTQAKRKMKKKEKLLT